MTWIYLILAGIFEIGWAVGMKYTDGFTKLVPSALTIGIMALSIYFLSLSIKTLPLGTAYAVWTGIGAIGTVIMGIFLFKDPVSFVRIFCLFLILAGIIGLKISS